MNLATILYAAENSNDSAERALWKHYAAARPLEADMIPHESHYQQNEAAIKWARAEVAKSEAAE